MSILTKEQLEKNRIHAEAYNCKANATKNGVYVCLGKDNKGKNVFDFIPLEDVIYEGQNLKAKFEEIDINFEQLILKIQDHEEAIRLLANKVDGNRFLG